MLHFLILFVTGVTVGFINTLAGGATVIALSLLMFLGLPVNVAIGTYRIGALVQTATSIKPFHINNVLNVKKGIILGCPVIIGSLAGASMAVGVDEQLFRKIVAFILLIVLIFVVFSPKKSWKTSPNLSRPKPV